MRSLPLHAFITLSAWLALACGSDDTTGDATLPASTAGTPGAAGAPLGGAGAATIPTGMGGLPGTGAAGAPSANAGAAGMAMGTAGMPVMGTGGMQMGTGGMDAMATAGMPATGVGGMDMGAAGAGPDMGAAGMDMGGGADALDDGTMTFFVTSTGMGDGGNLGGLNGADAFCAQLAGAVNADFTRRTWRAYLSTSAVNAIDRIGTGPWRNADGTIIANTLAQLHDAMNAQPGGPLDQTWPIADTSIALDETGTPVPSGGGGGNVHDILTGTLADGTVAMNFTCNDWTSNADDPNINAQIGHSNRTGLAGQDQLWHSVHAVGCSQNGDNNVTQGGGRGSIYCFATITGTAGM